VIKASREISAGSDRQESRQGESVDDTLVLQMFRSIGAMSDTLIHMGDTLGEGLEE
jgi:hypothetical protein